MQDAVTDEDQRVARERDAFGALKARFDGQVAEMGRPELSSYFWYHTIDLGNGLVTPGRYDHRPNLDRYGFPEDMSGMRVLDVGSATGFFAFEFERRGADVVSLELPAGVRPDRFPDPTVPEPSAPDAGESHNRGAFKFCYEQLGSRVTRHWSTVYDLSPSAVGKFDLVFMGDILIHTIDPLSALAAATSVCRGRFVIAQDIPPGTHPYMLYIGGDGSRPDKSSWWKPNEPCLTEILIRLGFSDVTLVDRFDGLLRPVMAHYRRGVLAASR